MKLCKHLLLFAGLLLSQALCADTTVFAAASMTDVLKEIAATYQAQMGKAVKVSYAGSSTLAKQIENGAPADIFISADRDWMSYVEKRGFIAGTPFDLAQNRLVLIAPADSSLTVKIGKGMNLAGTLGKGRLATGDPASVPVGKYLRSALEYYGEWESMQPKIIPLENVRVALLVVEAREAQLGVVYATDAIRSPGVKVLDTFPQESHATIVYPAGRIKGQGSQEADEFFAFLRSTATADLLKKYGFILAPGT